MRLRELRIENFRSFLDETIRFDDYTCFVGPNGAGKSNVLTALNVFFRNTGSAATDVINLAREDFYLKDCQKPIRITATFGDLSAEAIEDLKAYYRQEKLIVTAVANWNEEAECATVEQHGQRFVMNEFASYFEADKAGQLVKPLRDIYGNLREKYPGLPAVTVKAQMATALREYEEENQSLCTLELSPDQFYGWRGSNKLSTYIQWVYVPAVKDAATEQQEAKTTALGQLLERTIRSKIDFSDELSALRNEAESSYNKVLEKNQPVLAELSKSLEARLQSWSHAGSRLDLNWHYDPGRSVQITPPLARILIGERDFLGEISRTGHGMQRSFIVALLQEEAIANIEGKPTLLLGMEEPELYQHPPQARHFAQLLENLSSESVQPVVTTHSPYFVSGKGFEAVRMVRPRTTSGGTSISQLTYQELSERLSKALGKKPAEPTAIMAQVEQVMQPSQAELFFSEVPVIVEGQEDVAFISTHLQLCGRWEEFRKYGCHFVLAGGKTNLSRPMCIAGGLGIPAFAIFDADGKQKEKKDGANHKRDNECLLRLCEADASNPFPEKVYWGVNVAVWPNVIFDEIRSDFGDQWDKAESEVRIERGLTEGVKRKNAVLISATLEVLWNQSHKSDTLQLLCEKILSFAANTRTGNGNDPEALVQ